MPISLQCKRFSPHHISLLMEEVQNLDPDENQVAATAVDHHLNVDTSRPFRSVKEAVAIFGERFLVGEIYSPKPFSFPKQETPFFSPSPKVDKEPSWKCSSPSPRGSSYSQDTTLTDTVKKLEAELEETKVELKLLKERESETEVALASLNAELHKSMSKVARAEAAAAGKAAASSGSLSVGGHIGDNIDHEGIIREEDKKRGLVGRKGSGPSPSLAQVLSVGEKESLFLGRKKERKGMKKKPIIPLVGDLFSRKKGSSTALHNPLYASSPLNLN